MTAYDQLDLTFAGARSVFVKEFDRQFQGLQVELVGSEGGAGRLNDVVFPSSMFDCIMSNEARTLLRPYFNLPQAALLSKGPTELLKLQADIDDVRRILRIDDRIQSVVKPTVGRCRTECLRLASDTFATIRNTANETVAKETHAASDRIANFDSFMRDKFAISLDRALKFGLSAPQGFDNSGSMSQKDTKAALIAKRRLSPDELSSMLVASLAREDELWKQLEAATIQHTAAMRSEERLREEYREMVTKDAAEKLSIVTRESTERQHEILKLRDDNRTAMKDYALAIEIIKRLDSRCVRQALQHSVIITSLKRGELPADLLNTEGHTAEADSEKKGSPIVLEADIGRVEHAVMAIEDAARRSYQQAQKASSNQDLSQSLEEAIPLSAQHITDEHLSRLGIKLKCTYEALLPETVTQQQQELLKGAVRYFEMRSQLETEQRRRAAAEAKLDEVQTLTTHELARMQQAHRADLDDLSSRLRDSCRESLRLKTLLQEAKISARTVAAPIGDSTFDDLTLRLCRATAELQTTKLDLRMAQEQLTEGAFPTPRPCERNDPAERDVGTSSASATPLRPKSGSTALRSALLQFSDDRIDERSTKMQLKSAASVTARPKPPKSQRCTPQLNGPLFGTWLNGGSSVNAGASTPKNPRWSSAA